MFTKAFSASERRSTISTSEGIAKGAGTGLASGTAAAETEAMLAAAVRSARTNLAILTIG